MGFNGFSGYVDKVLAFKDSHTHTDIRTNDHNSCCWAIKIHLTKPFFRPFSIYQIKIMTQTTESSKNHDVYSLLHPLQWNQVWFCCVLWWNPKATIYNLFANCFCWSLFCAPSIVNWAKINQLKNCFPFSQFWNNAIRSTCGKIYRWPSFCFDGFVVSDITFLCWGHKISKRPGFQIPE